MVKLRKRYVFGLYGTGGFSREVMPILKKQLNNHLVVQENVDIELYCIDIDPATKWSNDIPVITEEEFLKLEGDKKYFNIAISSSAIRQRISSRMLKFGIIPYQICEQNVMMYDDVSVGEGAIFCSFTTITSNVSIGRFFHMNIYSYIAHDCVIGDFVTFAPNVHCNGNISIKDHAYLGAGAIIKQGRPENPIIIGEGAIVGMGAVVTKNVPPFATVIGNPARIM
jgi:sugar O-acyltransferase (sialic acid O-acetyltransferase NeuD family)